MKGSENTSIRNVIVILFILIIILFLFDSLEISGNSFKNTGSIWIGGSPKVANLFVDGQYQGLTPKTVRFLSEGTHVLRLEKIGYKSFETVFDIKAGKKANSILFTLEPI